MTASVIDGIQPVRHVPEAGSAPPGVPGQGARDRAPVLSWAMAARCRAQWLIKESQELLAVAQVLVQASAAERRAFLQGQPGRLRREVLQRSDYLRLLARLETMPVIEQAKGILMARSGCNEDEAFDLLRRASQRSNVPVREIAAQIVANTVRASQATSKAGKMPSVPECLVVNGSAHRVPNKDGGIWAGLR